MKQLELRSYPRAEIADVLSVNINDSKHFKRSVENKLKKWGYGYNYSKRAVEIIKRPETPSDRLSEMMIREYNIDIQVNPLHFALFIYAFMDIEGFESMPWAEREKSFYKKYAISVDERTMRNWCSKLLESNVICRYGDGTAWKTEIIRGRKLRFPIDEEDIEDRQNFYLRRKELYSETYANAIARGLSSSEAKSVAWSDTYKALWAEFGCCYYYCKSFTLNAFDESNTIFDVYELIEELAGMASAMPQVSTRDFQSEWFTQ